MITLTPEHKHVGVFTAKGKTYKPGQSLSGLSVIDANAAIAMGKIEGPRFVDSTTKRPKANNQESTT